MPHEKLTNSVLGTQGENDSTKLYWLLLNCLPVQYPSPPHSLQLLSEILGFVVFAFKYPYSKHFMQYLGPKYLNVVIASWNKDFRLTIHCV